METYNSVLDMFDGDRSLSQFLVTILTVPQFSNHPAVVDLLANIGNIICTLSRHQNLYNPLIGWAKDAIGAECAREVRELTKVENGSHFSAVHAKAEQIEGFQIDGMALQIAGEAPVLWALLDSLLSARALQVSKIESKGHTEIGILVSDAQEAEDSEYWAQVDDLEGVIEGITGDCISRAERLASQRSATMMLVWKI